MCMILHDMFNSLKQKEEEDIRDVSYKNKEKRLLFEKHNLVLFQGFKIKL